MEWKKRRAINKKSQMILVNLLIFTMVVAVLIALIPALNAMLNIAQQSNSLNCNGYYDNGNPNATLSYNSSLATNTLACVSIRLYLPYIVLVVLIGGVSKLLFGRTVGGEQATFQ